MRRIGDDGLVAEFTSPEALVAAAKAARERGYARIDAYTPYPVSDLAPLLAIGRSPIPYLAIVVGAIGAVVQYAAQYWMNVIDFPINVGGRPLHSWPAFIPGPLVVAFLWGALAILVSFLILTRLPRLHHPLFDVPDFERASKDRLFLFIGRDDPRFDPDETAQFLQGLDSIAVRRVGSQ